MRLNELENKAITVYHGDDFNTSFLNPALMNNGNNQERIHPITETSKSSQIDVYV